nr:uncharacterized protein LOC109190933 [Ipomoea batatas]
MGRRTTRYLSAEERFAAHQYVLLNCEEVQPILRLYENGLRLYNPGCTDQDVDNEIERNFAAWFKGYVYTPMNDVCNQSLIDLASEPIMEVNTYTRYVVNGFKFQTEAYCSRKSTSNFGVSIKGSGLSQFESNFFGTLQEVIEVEYPNVPIKKVVLFKCEWFDPTPNVGSRYNSEYGIAEVHDSDSERTTSASPTSNAADLEGGSPTPSITTTPPTHSPDPNGQRIFIRPNGIKAFEPFDAHWKIIESITRYFPEGVKTYNSAPQSMKDIWFNEFKKACKSPPQWMSPAVLAQYHSIWNNEEFKKTSEKNKNNRNSDCGGMRPSLYNGGSIPITEHRKRLKEKLGEDPSLAILFQATHKRKKTDEFVCKKSSKSHDTQRYFPEVARRKKSRNGESSSHVACDEKFKQLDQTNKEILENQKKIMGLLQGIYSAHPELVEYVAPTADSNQSGDVGLDNVALMADSNQSGDVGQDNLIQDNASQKKITKRALN